MKMKLNHRPAMTLVLLLALFLGPCCTAVRIKEDQTSVKEDGPAGISENKSKSCATSKEWEKMGKVAKNLSRVLQQDNMKNSQLEKALSPLVENLNSMVQKHGGKDDVKIAQKEVEKLAKAMQKRGEEILKESRQEKTNLLMGVLLTKQKDALAKQYAVLEDSEFKTLPVVKEVEANKGKDERPLVLQCAEALDKDKKKALMQSGVSLLQKTSASFRAVQNGVRQLMELLQVKDCPYCKADCFERCTEKNNSYLTCMTECGKDDNEEEKEREAEEKKSKKQ